MSKRIAVLVVPRALLEAPPGPRATHFRVTGTDFSGQPVTKDGFFDPDNPVHMLPFLAREKDYGI